MSPAAKISPVMLCGETTAIHSEKHTLRGHTSEFKYVKACGTYRTTGL
jgi:hypothetical protein